MPGAVSWRAGAPDARAVHGHLGGADAVRARDVARPHDDSGGVGLAFERPYGEKRAVQLGRHERGRHEQPTGVLAANDQCALGLIRTLVQAGVEVPRDVSVVGYDDSHISHLTYLDLTTIRQDADRMAEHAVRLVVGRLENAALPPNEIVLDPKLVVRGTTGPPPN